MIKSLYLKNFALFKEIQICFESGFGCVFECEYTESSFMRPTRMHLLRKYDLCLEAFTTPYHALDRQLSQSKQPPTLSGFLLDHAQIGGQLAQLRTAGGTEARCQISRTKF